MSKVACEEQESYDRLFPIRGRAYHSDACDDDGRAAEVDRQQAHRPHERNALRLTEASEGGNLRAYGGPV